MYFCIFFSLFLSIRIFSLVIVRDLLQNYMAFCFIIIHVSWLIILGIPLLEKTLPVSAISGQFDVKNAKLPGFSALSVPLNSQFLGVKFNACRCVSEKIFLISISGDKETTKSNRLHKSIYKELLEKDWWLCSVH